MLRRGFLKSMTAGSLGGVLAQETRPQPADDDAYRTAGLDLREIDVVDAHVHPPVPMTLSNSYDAWNGSFVDAMLPAYDYEHKEELRGKLSGVFRDHLLRLPRQVGYNNYMHRVYGVSPDLAGFDSVVSRGIEGDFTAYIDSILDRERVPSLVLQSRSSDPEPPDTHIARRRYVWTYSIGDLVQPTWPAEQGLTELDEVIRRVDTILETCVEQRCAGFKVPIAYERPIATGHVSRGEALEGFASLPNGAGVRAYQDHLLRHIYVKAGELGVPIIIHSAVALHPALRFDFNDPRGLYDTFQDDEIKRVETRFVIIHAGYPYHQHVAALISQFPNVFTDVSFYAKFPGVLEELYRTFLSLAPSSQVLHGSDSNNVPEEIGYCADNTRRVLARVLRDFHDTYGWTASDCETIARGVMGDNARRVYGMA